MTCRPPRVAERRASRPADLAAVALAAVLAWLPAPQAIAQARGGGVSGVGMPEALKGIHAADGVCRPDTSSFPAPGSPSAGPGRTPGAEARCRLTPAELASLRKSDPQAVLIDVRSRPADDLPNHERVLQMPLAAVKTKPYLRERTLVLIGDGKAERELYDACAALVSQGYGRTRVLQGGLPNWRLSQGDPEPGQAWAASSPVTLSASELWAESQYEANLVLVSPGQKALRDKLPPRALPLPDLKPSTLSDAIKRWQRGNKGAFVAAVVLVMAPEEGEPDLRGIRESLQPLPLLVYADAASTYLRQQSQQNAVWSAQARGPKKPPCGL